jgi:hypothetical protein
LYGDKCTNSSTQLTHILHWAKTGTEPGSDAPTAPAKPFSNVGQDVTELKVPTVLAQAQNLGGVAAIKYNGNQIFYSISAFNLI